MLKFITTSALVAALAVAPQAFAQTLRWASQGDALTMDRCYRKAFSDEGIKTNLTLCFQPLQALADDRLRDPQPICRAHEVARFGNGQEHLQLVAVEHHSFRIAIEHGKFGS